MFVTGNTDALGNFDTDNAVAMTSTGTAQKLRFLRSRDLNEQFAGK